MQIRRANNSDAATIALLGRFTFTETFGHLFGDQQDLLDYLDRTFNVEKLHNSINKSNNLYWLAFVDNLPVGYAKLKLNSSSIPMNHELVEAGIAIGRTTYGSPTLSDQACLSCPSLKLGPGDSTRSHSADEFIYINEIEEGIKIYVELLEKVL